MDTLDGVHFVLPGIHAKSRFFLELYLREDHRGEHQAAAEPFPRRHALVQQQRAEDGGEDGFHTQKNGCDGEVQVLLTQDLQKICHTHGQESGVCQG